MSATQTDRTSDVVLLMEARAAAASGAARWLRRAAGLSQREMAEAIGRTPGAVSLWEHGERKPCGDAAIRYAQILRVIAAQLASGCRTVEPLKNDEEPAGQRPLVTIPAGAGPT